MPCGNFCFLVRVCDWLGERNRKVSVLLRRLTKNHLCHYREKHFILSRSCFTLHWKLWSYSCGIDCFWMIGFFLFYWGKTVFGWCGWSTFSTGLKLGWNGWKSVGSCSPLFNRKRFEKCSIETRQLYPLQPVTVETVDPSRPRPVALICTCCTSIIRYHNSLQTSTLLHVLSMLFLTVILCSTVFVV